MVYVREKNTNTMQYLTVPSKVASSIPMLDRLKFSIPISITIDAPIDVVWRVLTDIQSYPNILSCVEKTKPIEDRYSSHRRRSRDGGDVEGSQSNPSSTSQSNSQSNHGHQLKGSKWKVTRVSVLENQRYTANVTITQYNDKDANKRSFTMSTHQMLGATCSLRIIVETIQKPTSEDDDSSSQNQTSLQAKDDDGTPARKGTSEMSTSSTRANAQTQSSSSPQSAPPTTSQCCQVTAIMSMIPFQFFVKLVGIMCCLCLLKYRARMAMEHDLDDLATYCERMVATNSGTTGVAGNDNVEEEEEEGKADDDIIETIEKIRRKAEDELQIPSNYGDEADTDSEV